MPRVSQTTIITSNSSFRVNFTFENTAFSSQKISIQISGVTEQEFLLVRNLAVNQCVRACVRVCVCVCQNEKESARRMASTTSENRKRNEKKSTEQA